MASVCGMDGSDATGELESVLLPPRARGTRKLHVDFRALRIPPLILCCVATVKFLADLETDEVYAKLRLITLRNSDLDFEDDVLDGNASEGSKKPASFAKTLTQSDANKSRGFFVPWY
ncbi:hypothetical protein RJT34_18393 [Clitoria ternatea]|uniref:Uncharacterized protein n=1 Tax=Clitoria ternatea TaxID=43366 RepID=A0AAN9JC03_CLITE